MTRHQLCEATTLVWIQSYPLNRSITVLLLVWPLIESSLPLAINVCRVFFMLDTSTAPHRTLVDYVECSHRARNVNARNTYHGDLWIFPLWDSKMDCDWIVIWDMLDKLRWTVISTLWLDYIIILYNFNVCTQSYSQKSLFYMTISSVHIPTATSHCCTWEPGMHAIL